MRIAIDARKLHDYGIGTYVRNLLRHLARLDHETEYVADLPPRGLGGRGGARRELPPAARARAVATRCGSSTALPYALRRVRAQLFHAPHYVLPPLTPCRSVVTIHDLIHLRFPEYLPNRLAYAYARAVIWSRPSAAPTAC